jgi:hypothetical protein
MLRKKPKPDPDPAPEPAEIRDVGAERLARLSAGGRCDGGRFRFSVESLFAAAD